MDMLTYISALLAVFLLLGLFALVMRQMTQGGQGAPKILPRILPQAWLRFLPRALRLQTANPNEGFAIAAVKMIDARRKIVAVDYRDKRYILLLSQQHELLLDTLARETAATSKTRRHRSLEKTSDASRP